MGIWKEFKTIREFESIKNKRQCYSTCVDCSNKWDKITTEFVHMVVEKGETRFICDNCAENRN